LFECDSINARNDILTILLKIVEIRVYDSGKEVERQTSIFIEILITHKTSPIFAEFLFGDL
jgi:hypothetical protein